MKLIYVILVALLPLLTACTDNSPTEEDIAAAWRNFQPQTRALYEAKAITELNCKPAGNRAFYCTYKMGSLEHNDVFHKSYIGGWEVLMLDKKDVADD